MLADERAGPALGDLVSAHEILHGGPPPGRAHHDVNVEARDYRSFAFVV